MPVDVSHMYKIVHEENYVHMHDTQDAMTIV